MDIRKFFAVSSQSRSSAKKISSTNEDSRIKHAKVRKRPTPVLSDSDSESPLPSSEQPETKKRVIDDSHSENTEKTTVSKKSSKDPKLKVADVDDFFGRSPVRRKTSNVTRNKPTFTPKQIQKSEGGHVSTSATEGASCEISISKSPQKRNSKEVLAREHEIANKDRTTPNKKSRDSEPRRGVKTVVEREVTPDKKQLTHHEEQSSQKLSDDRNSEKKRNHYLQYRRYLDRSGPQALGSKVIPEGKPGCLSGLTFVITGVLESFEREEIKEMIERYKGKVTNSLSKSTSYLVIGRDPGPAKVEKAQKLGTAILDEDQLLQRISSTGENTSPEKQKITVEKKREVSADDTTSSTCISGKKTDITQKETEKRNGSPVEFTKVKRKKPDKSTENVYSEEQLSKKSRKCLNTCISADYKSEKTADALKCKVDEMQQVNNSKSQLFKMWVDKYKPTSTKQIIGQQGDRSNVKKLQQWLLSWHKNHDCNKKPATSKLLNKNDGASLKAALLSGHPGVGKTTTAQLVCKECNYDYIELNASDTRSKKSLKELVEGTIGNKTLINYASGEIKNGVSSNHAIIMDEVDGMAGTQDRGGMQELIALIKSSKVPIICICNDRSSPKIRSLSNYCYDLRFQKPRIEQIKSSIMSIAYKENVQLAPNVLQDIIIASNQDIRQVLHSLSLWCAKKQLTAEQSKHDIGNGIKNVNIGPFEALRKIFSHSETQKMTIHQKSDLFFTNYSLIPLFVQENYVAVQPTEAKRNIVKHLQLLSGASDSLCDSDLVEKQIRTNNNWNLLPVQAIYASVIPGEIMSGVLTQMINFPSWLGKNSTVNHMKRILQQIHSHMRLKVSANRTDLQLDQLTLLNNAITKPLIEREMDGVSESISVLSSYCLLREDMDSIVELTQWQGKRNPMLGISPKVKSALTRTYNKEGIMNPYTIISSKKSREKESSPTILDEGSDVEEATDDDADDDDVNTDAMIKIKKNKNKIDGPAPQRKSKARAKQKV